jgi:hypothetical protein
MGFGGDPLREGNDDVIRNGGAQLQSKPEQSNHEEPEFLCVPIGICAKDEPRQKGRGRSG